MSDDSVSIPQMIDVSGLGIEQAVRRLIDHACRLGASDLFFCANEQHFAVQIRHLGIVRPISILQPEVARRHLGYLKANSGMDLTEKRRPADGRWIYTPSDGGETVDLRINFIPTLYGEDVAIRLLTRGNRLYSLENLGMTQQQLQQYGAMITSPSGMILITGPTGSGKTATLYASLIRLNDGRRKINTIEDPIEYAIDGLRQSQVNPQIDLGFGELLRSVLRQNPDVIMIGEIRDAETAQTAVHAANSGMLVFATLHAPTSAHAVQSMRALGVHPHFLGACLRGVVSQRLVRTLDPQTKVAIDLSSAPDAFQEIRRFLQPGEGRTLYAPRVSASNHFTGYTGRTGVFEVMNISHNLRTVISEGGSVRQIRERAVMENMLEFRQAAMLKVAKGVTTTEEVFRVIPAEHLVLEDDEPVLRAA
jgi:type II secretory ATPase GspE/PulE/Tfp pilus assembly ATPase PilB-like protein